ncbi:MAG: FHA domain-containing protein [Acidimicrobiia bacterium]
MICARCGHENPEGANFCSSCGAPLAADETTLTIAAVDERVDADAELADVIDELPDGVGMIVVSKGPNAGSKYLLQGEVTTAGRHPESTIFLDDVTVSRRHALIRHDGAVFRLQDVGSLNGTYVNRSRVDDVELHNGDVVQIGRYHLVFFVGGAREAGQ